MQKRPPVIVQHANPKAGRAYRPYHASVIVVIAQCNKTRYSSRLSPSRATRSADRIAHCASCDYGCILSLDIASESISSFNSRNSNSSSSSYSSIVGLSCLALPCLALRCCYSTVLNVLLEIEGLLSSISHFVLIRWVCAQYLSCSE